MEVVNVMRNSLDFTLSAERVHRSVHSHLNSSLTIKKKYQAKNIRKNEKNALRATYVLLEYINGHAIHDEHDAKW